MKTYIINVMYCIQADNEADLEKQIEDICYNEYYGGYEIVDIEDEKD